MSIKPTLSDPTPTASFLRQRIAYCVRVLRIFLSSSGIVLLIVQLFKAFDSIADGESISSSVVITSTLAILLLAASLPPFLEKAIARFAARMHYLSFRIYTYFLPILLTILILWAKIKIGATSNRWHQISYEGGLSEYGTAIAYLLLPVFAVPIAKQFWRQKKKLMAWLYWLLSFASVFVSMEEISWGQRIIGFEEPEFWAKNNAQSEFTFHNLSIFQENLLDLSFLVIGFIGSFCWIALHYWQHKLKVLDLSYILPPRSISSFFYPIFIFHLIFGYTDGFNFFLTRDQEHAELIMSLGILLFVIINFLRQGKERRERDLV